MKFKTSWRTCIHNRKTEKAESTMLYTRREIGKLALASLPAAHLLTNPVTLFAADEAARPDSTIGGVNVGIIAPYAFRGDANDIDTILAKMVELGLSHVEMQAEPVEAYAGAPARGRGGRGRRGGGRRGGTRGQTQPGARGQAEGEGGRDGRGPAEDGERGRGGEQAGGRGGRGRGRRSVPLTPEERAAMQAAGAPMREWRLAQPPDKFEEIKKKYNDAGVSIDIVKFGLGPGMTDEEVEYCFRVAKLLGCRAITCEPPVSETRRLGQFAEKHEIRLGFHNHADATGVESFCRPGSWEQAFFYSDWNGANVDIGHFCAGNSVSPIDFIRMYHDRITNLHLKDRKFDNGPNMPWGEGDTPIRQVLQLMKNEGYPFMATIELEYDVPDVSDVMTELAKCVAYCKEALA
jgi:sugar phosphate isomerase/epimerase